MEVNNSETLKIADKFVSTEELLNQNIEIENKITSTELINFYFEALVQTNKLVERNNGVETNISKINDTLVKITTEIKNLNEVTEKQKTENRSQETIVAYKESWDNMQSFVKTLLTKLNNVTIQPKTLNNMASSQKKEEKKDDTLKVTMLSFAIIGVVIIGLYKLFF